MNRLVFHALLQQHRNYFPLYLDNLSVQSDYQDCSGCQATKTHSNHAAANRVVGFGWKYLIGQPRRWTPPPSAGVFHAQPGFRALHSCMNATPQFDKLLAEVEAAAAKQPNKSAIEHVVLSMLRKAKDNPQLADDLERLCPTNPSTSPERA